MNSLLPQHGSIRPAFQRITLLLVCFSIISTLFFVASSHNIDYNEVYTSASKKIQSTFTGEDDTSEDVVYNNDGASNPQSSQTDPIIGLSNSTLGFQKILVLSDPFLYDLSDIASMQASISGLIVESYNGVSPDSLNTHGLPPDSLRVLPKSEQSRYRSHANMWRHMLNEDWSTVLIIESDATWDVNIRRLMQLFSNGLQEFMRKQGKFDYHDEVEQVQPIKKYTSFDDTSKDPYFSANWDVLQLGGCLPTKRNAQDSYPYFDPYVPESLYFYGTPIPSQRRVVRHKSPERCATAYAVSRNGALKLLLATSIDMSTPVDVAIRQLTRDGKLDTYSTYPPLFSRWEYLEGLKSKEGDKPLSHGERRKLWGHIHDTLSAWKAGGTSTLQVGSDTTYIGTMLENFKSYIFGKKPDLRENLAEEPVRENFDGEEGGKDMENEGAPADNDDGLWVIAEMTPEESKADDAEVNAWIKEHDYEIAQEKAAAASAAAEEEAMFLSAAAAAASSSAAAAAASAATAVATTSAAPAAETTQPAAPAEKPASDAAQKAAAKAALDDPPSGDDSPSAGGAAAKEAPAAKAAPAGDSSPAAEEAKKAAEKAAADDLPAKGDIPPAGGAAAAAAEAPQQAPAQ